jgi:hypothetical protein
MKRKGGITKEMVRLTNEINGKQTARRRKREAQIMKK